MDGERIFDCLESKGAIAMTFSEHAVEAALSAYTQHPAKGDATDAMRAVLTALDENHKNPNKT
jgi:hypothetical protein